LRVKSYKFGTNYKSILYRWKPGRGLPVLTELRDSTLRPPSFLKWQALFERGPMLSTGLSTGFIAYLHPVDPPLFTPYYKIIIRDIVTNLEIDIANAGLTTSGAKFSADGEKLIYGDGNGSMFLLNPWNNEQLKTILSYGESLTLSPDGASWFADGAVFNGDRPAVLIAPEGEAAFSTDSSLLFVSSGTKLYLISGITPLDGALFAPKVAEKVAKLRSMRIQGLITASDYKASMERILKP